MHYKRKGHRGRHKKNTMDNQGQRFRGNAASAGTKSHVAPAVRNLISKDDLE